MNSKAKAVIRKHKKAQLRAKAKRQAGLALSKAGRRRKKMEAA